VLFGSRFKRCIRVKALFKHGKDTSECHSSRSEFTSMFSELAIQFHKICQAEFGD
jgi:hypothetical protein